MWWQGKIDCGKTACRRGFSRLKTHPVPAAKSKRGRGTHAGRFKQSAATEIGVGSTETRCDEKGGLSHVDESRLEDRWSTTLAQPQIH